MQNRKSNYSAPVKSQHSTNSSVKKGGSAPYNLTFSVGDELIRLTGLFENKSKKGTDYLGVKKIRAEDAAKLVEVLSNAAEGTEIGVFVFENKPKA